MAVRKDFKNGQLVVTATFGRGQAGGTVQLKVSLSLPEKVARTEAQQKQLLRERAKEALLEIAGKLS